MRTVIFNRKSMNIPAEFLYTEDHEWVKIEGNIATVGITDFAQGELGDVVYVDITTEGETIDKGEVFGTIEAVKTVSDLFMPLSGEIIEFNSALEDEPEIINGDAYAAGWMVKIKLSDSSEKNALMSAEKYEAHIS